MRGLHLARVLLALLLGTCAASAEDMLKVAVGARGVGETFVAELGQNAGIFKKHGLTLEILYTQGGGETQQVVISDSAQIGVATGFLGALGAFAKGAPIRIIGSEIVGAPDLYWYVPAASPIKKIEDFNGKTVAFSLTGSSSHAGLLALIAQYHLDVKPTSTGSISATVTQTMTGQVDVGFGAVPYGLDMASDGRIRIIASGNDVASLRTRSGRVNLTNAATLESRKDALKRFNEAYKETVDWMYSSPEALKIYAEFAKVPESAVGRVRELIPKDSVATDKVVGVDQIMAEAIQNKFLAAPLTKEQLAELIRVGELK